MMWEAKCASKRGTNIEDIEGANTKGKNSNS